MNRLAKEYGISGNGLAKICDRLNVPYPPRGWWSKKAAGKKVMTYQLPPAEPSTPQTVTISPTPPKPEAHELPAEIQPKFDGARTGAAGIAIPGQLKQPHRIIQSILVERERKRRDAKREREPHMRKTMDPGEFTETDRRRHRILDTLFKALEKQGGKLKVIEKGGFSAEMHGETIAFLLRERQKQVRRPPTSDEQRWALPDGKPWRQELQSTGRLYLTIRTYMGGCGLRSEWIEGDRNAMETLLPDIIGTFVAAWPMLAEQRKAREKAELQRRIAEQERYEQQQLQKADDSRWRRFVEFAHQQREAEIAHDFLQSLKEMDFEQDHHIAGNPVSDWIAWAEDRLAHAYPLRQGVNSIFEAIARITAWSYRD